MVRSCGSTSSTSSQRDRGRHRADRVAAHRVRAGDRVVAGVLVVVDEDGLGVAVLAPPRRRHVLGRATLDLAGEGQGGAAHLLEAVVGPDADVDVEAVAAARLGEAGGAELVEDLVGDVRDPADPVERRVRHRVEVDAPLVRLLGVGAAAVPRVELDGAHLHGPDDVREVGGAELVGVQPVAGEVQPHRLEPRRRAAGDALLVDLGAVDAVGEAVQHRRPLAQGVEDPVADGDVVVREVELGLAARGEVDPLGARQLDLVAGHVEVDRFPELTLARSHAPHRMPSRPPRRQKGMWLGQVAAGAGRCVRSRTRVWCRPLLGWVRCPGARSVRGRGPEMSRPRAFQILGRVRRGGMASSSRRAWSWSSKVEGPTCCAVVVVGVDAGPAEGAGAEERVVVARWRWSTGQVVCARPVGSRQLTVPSGSRRTVQPVRCLMRWWRRQRAMRLLGCGGSGRPGADVVEVAVAGRGGAAGKAARPVAQSHQAGHGGGDAVGVALATAGARALCGASRAAGGERGGDIAGEQCAGDRVAHQLTVPTGSTVRSARGGARGRGRVGGGLAARSDEGVVDPGPRNERRAGGAEPAHLDQPVSGVFAAGSRAGRGGGGIVGGAGGVDDDADVAVFEDELHEGVGAGQLERRRGPVAHQLAGAFGDRGPCGTGLLDEEVAPPVSRCRGCRCVGSVPGGRARRRRGRRPPRGRLVAAVRASEPAQRPDGQPGPARARRGRRRRRRTRGEELGLLGHGGGALLVEVTTGHGVDDGGGAGQLVDRIRDPPGGDVHRDPHPRCGELGRIQPLVPQPVVHLDAGAVLEQVRLASRTGAPARPPVAPTRRPSPAAPPR